MRYALVDNQKTEAKKGLKGLCPGCMQPVIAKCGEQKINHWAHVSVESCDSWWEPETEWHRFWKDKFPKEWQEIFLIDPRTGEKHVADVRTPQGLVIEFQHSHIDPEERISREKFYKNMVWVVDGTRLKNDYKRLFIGDKKEAIKNAPLKGFFLSAVPKERFPKMWKDSNVSIIFDFLGIESPDHTAQEDQLRNHLWFLLPGRAQGNAVFTKLSYEVFINIVKNEPNLIGSSQKIVDNIKKIMQHHRIR